MRDGGATATRHPYGITPPAFRLPNDTRLGRVILQVSDLGRSVDFYENILGLEVLERGPATARLGVRNDRRVLVELREKRGIARPPRRRRLGLFHVAILLPTRADLGRFVLHLDSRGIRAGMSDHLVSEAIYLQDPDDLGIEVYADRPRSMWRNVGAELVMATEPLDVRSLIDAARGSEWQGAPPGTTVGHIHLHVGSLDGAASFYHDVLGFDKTVWSYPGALFLAAGGYHHHLGVNTWATAAEPPRDNEAQLLEWEIVVPAAGDVDAAAASVAGAGVAVDRGDATWWTARDPWGIAFRVTSR